MRSVLQYNVHVHVHVHVLWHYNIVLWLGSEMPAATHTLINIPLLRYTYIYMACCVRVHLCLH